MLRPVPFPLPADFLHQLGYDRAVADFGPLHADDERQPRRFAALYWHSEANQLGWSHGRRGGVGQLDGQAWLTWLHGGGFLGLVGAWLVEHEVRLDRAPGAPRIEGFQLPCPLDDLARDLTLAAQLGCPLLSAGFSARRGSRLVGAGIYTQVMTSSAEQAREPIGPPRAEPSNGLSLVPPPAEPPSAPMREFLGWVVFRPRTHADVMDAWQSHCPRFTLWEDALGAGLVELEPGAAGLGSASVRLTARGRAALNIH